MNKNRKAEQTEEMIDFKRLIRALWHGKWLILGAAILSGLIAFLISSNFLPVRYRASAIITVNVRSSWNELIEKGISQMARSDEIIDLTCTEMGITDLEKQHSLEFVAFMEYWGKLELEVRAGDPDLAARTVNAWADLVFEGIYEILGVSEEFLDELEEDVAQAEASWFTAKHELDDYLSESDLESYPEALSALKSTLVTYQEVIDRNHLIISDILTLEAQIEGMNPSENLTVGIVLSLINLQGRVAALDEEIHRLSQDDLSQDIDLNTSEAQVILQQLKDALEYQNQELREETATLEEEIRDLEISLEKGQNEVEDLTLTRDLARTTYQKLANQLTDFTLYKNQVDHSVSISTRALRPGESYRPDILANTGFSGISAALVTMLGLLFYDWWKVKDDA